MYDTWVIENIGENLRRDFVKKQEAALMKWLGVDSLQGAVEVIEDLRCRGLKAVIESTEPAYSVEGDGKHYKYTGSWTVEFKIVPLVEEKVTDHAVSRITPRPGRRGSRLFK